MRELYEAWLAEDPNCSWVTLTDCFRQCGLQSLARSIEQHFGLPSPLLDTEGGLSSVDPSWCLDDQWFEKMAVVDFGVY